MKKYYFLSREKIVQNKKLQTTETNPSILKILKKKYKKSNLSKLLYIW